MVTSAKRLPGVRRSERHIKWGRVILQILLSIGSLFMVFPLAYQLAASLCTPIAYTRSTWFPVPDSLYLDNYIKVFTEGGVFGSVLIWSLNAIIRISWYILVPAIVAILAGYVFARVRFRGRDTVFMILLSSMMVPPIVYLVPTYIMFARWPLAGENDITGQGGHGLINQWPSLLISGLVNVYYIFLMRQTYYNVPQDFEDAARVDGATTFQVLRRVYLPLLTPVLTVLVIFQSVALWNDYLWPLIVAGGNQDIWPIALGAQQLLSQITGTGHATNYPLALTIATIVTVPTVLLFLFLQRYFIEGVQSAGLKG